MSLLMQRKHREMGYGRTAVLRPEREEALNFK